MYEIEFYEDKNGKSEVATRKTPKREIKQAKRNLQDYLERNTSYAHMERTEK